MPTAGPPLKSPLLRFLAACHADFSAETGGTVADYIPELGKADPDHFGISLATLDGHVYEVGDSRMPFTIQSMSKPFVFALALDTLGAARGRKRNRRRAVGRSLQFDPAQRRQPSLQSHGQRRRDRLLRPDPSRPRATAPSTISAGRWAGLPGANSMSTKRSTPPKAQPATATARSAISCATPPSSRMTWPRCWTSISGNAPSW